jgi:YrbI family 3-deoxy-D-manno-octulosonate 8-phosphate phosphatase
MLTPGGEEIKVFNVRDGTGMKYWKRAGGLLGMISGRNSPAVVRRAEELGVDAVQLGAKDKIAAYEKMLAELGVESAATCVVGDDLTDLPLVRECGLGVAAADAVDELKEAADYVTKTPGGKGCVREVVELILRNSGKWDGILARYLPQENKRS